MREIADGALLHEQMDLGPKCVEYLALHVAFASTERGHEYTIDLLHVDFKQ